MSKNTEHKGHRDGDDSDSDYDRRDLKLYKRMKKLMLCDPELMVTGSECYADIYNTALETIAIDSNVTFEYNNALAQAEHIPNTSDLVIKKSGIYMVLNILNVDDPSQWTIYINGISNAATTTGLNSGATQSTRASILALNCGDIVTIRNHISPKDVALTVNAGGDGTVASVNAHIILVRIAPYVCPTRPCGK